MKKLYTLATLLVVALTVNAQNYRKWDFTNWSAETVENLKAEAAQERPAAGWSDIEKAADDKAGATAPEATAGKCFWYDAAEQGELKANGQLITELEGLFFGATYCDNRSLAIAVNYPSTSLGEYAGPQYLWLGGGGKNMVCFTIPKVRIGQKMTFVVESHKPSDARGIELYVGSIAAENKIGESFKPTTQETRTWEEGWTLPEGATANDDGETVDIIVYNTSGCHIYSIEIGDNTEKSKVGIISQPDVDDPIYPMLEGNDKFTTSRILANGAFTLDQLATLDLDAIVISPNVTDTEALASLKAIQPFIPTLNLNTAVYGLWGYGEVVDGFPFADVVIANSPLFKGVELVENPDVEGAYVLPLTQGSNAPGVVLADYFANDQVLATMMMTDAVAIHAHNLNRNAYIYLPYTDDTALQPVILNAVNMLVNSKAKISQAPKPSFAQQYKDMETIVSLSSTVTGAQIFYTLDGTEPTTESTKYTEPISITTEGITVKAVALGDGYLLSDVAEVAVELKHQTPAPTITLVKEDGKTLVTLSSDQASTNIYYNFNGNSSVAQSELYLEPFVLTNGRTVYAFAEAEGMIASELVSQLVSIQGEAVRIDIMSHMDASSAVYNNGSTSTAYYFSWGKNKSGENGYNYYDPEQYTEEVVTDPVTGDETTVRTYTVMNPEEEKDFGTGWMLRSRGQIVDWENLTTGYSYGNSDGYNFNTVFDVNEDFPATKGAIVLADKNTIPEGASFPYNAYLVTTEKFKGPFNVVSNMGSITKPDAGATHYVVLEVSADGNQWESPWQTLGDTIVISNTPRQTHNIVRSYEGEDEVYVRAYISGGNSKVGFYDIYLANAGEKSQERVTGIEETKAADAVEVRVAAIYSLNGARQQSLQRGLNIVRYTDGTARKIVVK